VASEVGGYVRQHVRQAFDQCLEVFPVTLQFGQLGSVTVDFAGQISQQGFPIRALFLEFIQHRLLLTLHRLDTLNFAIDLNLHTIQRGEGFSQTGNFFDLGLVEVIVVSEHPAELYGVVLVEYQLHAGLPAAAIRGAKLLGKLTHALIEAVDIGASLLLQGLEFLYMFQALFFK